MHGYISDQFAESVVRISADYSNPQVPNLNNTDISMFIDGYRKLPLAARARIENWNINPELIKKKSNTCSSRSKKSYGASYHGLDVYVIAHEQVCDDESSNGCYLHTEISAMVQLRHPNIVGFLGVSMSSVSCMIVMEFMPLGSLRAFYLSKQADTPSWRPSKSRALAWSLDLLRAVNYLHQSDPAITHRDLCPDTVFLTSSGVLKVSCFGRCSIRPSRSKNCRSRSARPSLAGIDLLLRGDEPAAPPPPPPHGGYGSAYAAPELQRDPACADEGVDVFAAAMLIAFIHTGRDPERPAPPPSSWSRSGLNGTVAAAVAQAGAEDPAARPSADELTDRLEALQGRRMSGCRVS